MRVCLSFLVAAIPFAAFAQETTIKGCRVAENLSSAECHVTNRTPTAIAAMSYGVWIGEEGRTVPWGEATGEIEIPGGIEPGETVPVTFPIGRLPDRARGRPLKWEFFAVEPPDVDGRPISTADRAAVAPLTTGELAVFRDAIEACWAVDAGDEAANVAVTVRFQLDIVGRVAGDVELVSSTEGSEEAVASALAAARRAVLRCQGAGYPLPPEKHPKWALVEITFDPANAEIR